MAELLEKVDCLQIGENMNEEYSWSTEIEDLLTQFHFQLTRGATKNLEDKYQEILIKLFKNTETNKKYIIIMYKLIGYTRDIINGKGEAQLTYMLISGLYKFSQSSDCDPNDKYKIIAMATNALESLVRLDNGEHPYGSWKDLKYFCNYHIPENKRSDEDLKELKDPLFTTAVNLICGQLQCDEHAHVKSLVAKWIPREKSKKFGWLTSYIAMKYYNKWITPNLSPIQYKIAKRKCLTHFRQLVSKINKEINTPQISQCNGSWSDINFEKNVTSITMRKQSNAFQGIDKEGNNRTILDSEDRQKCSENYKSYIQKGKEGIINVKGKRVSMNDFVKDAIAISTEGDSVERERINLQWANNQQQNDALENCIAMIDTSGTMEYGTAEPLYSAIGLGIRIAEKSKLGKRVLTFSSAPTWINLNDCQDFVGMVQKIYTASWGQNANFAAALDMILNTAIENQISPYEMKNMTLIILSDMQIEQNEKGQGQEQGQGQEKQNNKQNNKQNIMFNIMKTKYMEAGMRSVYQEPYTVPHIVFWNLKPTNGFPSLAKTENTSMMSGNNPALINAFCNKGLSILHHLNPWNFLVRELSNPRYSIRDTLYNFVKPELR